jgi:arsenate reductase
MLAAERAIGYDRRHVGATRVLLFVRLRYDPGLARPFPGEGVSMHKVVFACRHSAGRSQMAAAFLNRDADPEQAHAISAGTTPADRIHPEVAAAMMEIGIDLSGATPRLLTSEVAADAALLVTMGCGEECPYLPGVPVEDWPLDDPKGQPVERVREIRSEVERRVADLLRRRGWGRARTD